MKTRCRIVCPLACQHCDITPCTDRMADEDTEGKVHIAAAQAVALTSRELFAFFDGSERGGAIAPNPYEDIENVKEAEALKHCGMKSDLSCRICHDDTCRVRMAKRTT